MAHFPLMFSLLLSLIMSSNMLQGVYATWFRMVNKCDYTVWPGILSNAGVAPLSTTGFSLASGEYRNLSAPPSWSGRFWGRTHCTTDSNTGKFSCLTGDCGSGDVLCSGSGGTPPATLAEFTLDGAGGLDYFGVSLVDGYNLPMMVTPQSGSGTGNCFATGCVADLNGSCATELRVTRVNGSYEVLACKSACEAFQQPEYCCGGAYNTAETCRPSSYSQVFKSACPRARSYAYDNSSSTFMCANADYAITFCPAPSTRQKSSTARTSSDTKSSTAPTSSDTTTSTNTSLLKKRTVVILGLGLGLGIGLSIGVKLMCHYQMRSSDSKRPPPISQEVTLEPSSLITTKEVEVKMGLHLSCCTQA